MRPVGVATNALVVAAMTGLLQVVLTMQMAVWAAEAVVVGAKQRQALLLFLPPPVVLTPVVMASRRVLAMGVAAPILMLATAVVACPVVTFLLPSTTVAVRVAGGTTRDLAAALVLLVAEMVEMAEPVTALPAESSLSTPVRASLPWGCAGWFDGPRIWSSI